MRSQTVQSVAEEWVTCRRQFKRAKLRWRVSHVTRRSLGWVPVTAPALRYKSGQARYCGQALSLWDSYGLSGYELGTGSLE